MSNLDQRQAAAGESRIAGTAELLGLAEVEAEAETFDGNGAGNGAEGDVEFEIAPCTRVDELERCIELQQETWGYPDREVVPKNLFVLAPALGGHVLAAWVSGNRAGNDRTAHRELAGFAMAMPAHEPAGGGAPGTWMQPAEEQRERGSQADGQYATGNGSIGGGSEGSGPVAPPSAYLHSHMVAVAPVYQNRGLGFALKLAQREAALRSGIAMMRWTFDPKSVKNAWFNLHRLGATVRSFLPDFYGPVPSALQGDLPSDRMVAEWALGSERVCRAVARQELSHIPVIARIAVPAELARWRECPAGRRAQLQAELGRQLEDAFGARLQAVDFAAGADGGGEYLLASPADCVG